MYASGLGQAIWNWDWTSHVISHVPASTRWHNEMFPLTMLQSPLFVFCHIVPSYERCCAKTRNYLLVTGCRCCLPVRAGCIDPLLRVLTKIRIFIARPGL